MDKNAQTKESFEKETGIDETLDQPLAIRTNSPISKPKPRRPKRGGCGGSLAGGGLFGSPQVGINIVGITPHETRFLRGILTGAASTFLAGNPGTTLAGRSTVSLLPGTPGTSLLLLSNKTIPQGAIVKKTDLEVYVLPEHENIPDKSIRVEDLVEKVAPDSIPAHTLLGLVVLTGDTASDVEIKHTSDRALVIRTKKAIRKHDVINKEDLEVYLIPKPLSNPDMFTNSDDLVGKTATKNIKEHKILYNFMVE